MAKPKKKTKPKTKVAPKAKAKSAAKRKAVAKVVASKPRSKVTVVSADSGLRDGIANLARIMAEARRDLAALQANDMRLRDLPGATDELSAVVAATESATNAILDAVESIEKTAGTMPADAGDAVRVDVTRIYEACNFQDITGQRITKVVSVLKDVDRTVAGLMEAFGIALDPAQASAIVSAPRKAKGGEADLLNGPQMPDAAHDQAAIDALFDKS